MNQVHKQTQVIRCQRIQNRKQKTLKVPKSIPKEGSAICKTELR